MVFHDVGDVHLDDVPDPNIRDPHDAIPRSAGSAICGTDQADIHPGYTVAVFGCGPVGQFASISVPLVGAGRVLAVDCIDARLQQARENGAEIINFEKENALDAYRLFDEHQAGWMKAELMP